MTDSQADRHGGDNAPERQLPTSQGDLMSRSSRRAHRAGRAETPDGRVSTLELFFDLVFVFTLTQLTAGLAADLSATGMLRVLLIFGVLWWMYGGYGWLTNAVSPRRTHHRLLLMLGMTGFLVVALAIPGAFDGTGVALGFAYLLVVGVHTALFIEQPMGARGIRRVAPFNIVAAAAVIGAGFAAGPARYVLWFAALMLQAITPHLANANRWFPIRPSHLVERHGLLVIVALGESVVAIGIGAAGLDVDAGLVAAATTGLALAGALWWAYFGSGEDERAERAFTETPDERRPQLALNAYFYSHLPLLLGIVVVAAGMKKAMGHAFEPAEWGSSLALAGGVTLFVAGDVMFRRCLRLGPVNLRVLVAVLALGTIWLGVAVAPVAQLVVLSSLLAITLVIEPYRGPPHDEESG